MCWESFAVVRFDLGPLVQGQTAVAKLKSAYISIIIGLEVWDVKTTYRKTCAGNLFFDVVRFDLGPLVQGQTTMSKLKSATYYWSDYWSNEDGQSEKCQYLASRGLGCKTHFKQHIFAPRWAIIPLQWSC